MRSIGESWELSGVAGHESIVAEGPCKGGFPAGADRPLRRRTGGKEQLRTFRQRFPLLVKFIDAREDLSIQVHPDDRLAWERHRMQRQDRDVVIVVSETAAPVCVSVSTAAWMPKPMPRR